MAKKENTKPVKRTKKKETPGEVVEVYNHLIEAFLRADSFKKLRKLNVSPKYKFKIFKLMELMLRSPESQAFMQAKAEIVQTEGAEGRIAMNHPKLQDLLNQDSGLRIEKIQIPISVLEKSYFEDESGVNFSAEDMFVVSDFVEFVEDKENE